YRQAGGDGDLFCWIAEHFATPPVSRPDNFLQRIELAWLVIYNTYLDCASTILRRHQLARLQQIITLQKWRPVITCADFNLPPRPLDGLNNGQPSTFNHATDRRPFGELLANAGLTDSTAIESPQFTIERKRAGQHTQFRCDLALIPDYLHRTTIVQYNHA